MPPDMGGFHRRLQPSKAQLSAAFTERRQLQRFHFHLDFKQLYKKTSNFVKLILFIVGLDGVFKR